MYDNAMDFNLDPEIMETLQSIFIKAILNEDALCKYCE